MYTRPVINPETENNSKAAERQKAKDSKMTDEQIMEKLSVWNTLTDIYRGDNKSLCIY